MNKGSDAELRGTMECPYCGVNTPHPHSPQEISGMVPGLAPRLERLEKELPNVGFYSAMHRAYGTDYSHLAEKALQRDLRQVVQKLRALTKVEDTE